jgi:hypothetical protein
VDGHTNLIKAARRFHGRCADYQTLEGLELATLVLEDGTPVLSIAIRPEAAERIRQYAKAAQGIAAWIASKEIVHRVRTELILGLYDLFPEGEPLPESEARELLDCAGRLAEIDGDPPPGSLAEARARLGAWDALGELEPPEEEAPPDDSTYWSDDCIVPEPSPIAVRVSYRTDAILSFRRPLQHR